MRKGLLINLDRCSGCDSCIVACKLENDLPLGHFYNKVIAVGPTGTFPDVEKYWLPSQCQQCENPACVHVCPTAASYRDPETGMVLIDKEKCIGCMTCEKSCPYGHPVQLDDGLSHKCVLCSDENPEGTPDPTCAKACPVRALEFGPIASLREAHPEGAAAIGELTDETGPAVVFALHRDADKGGTLRNPQEVGHEA